MKRAAWVIVLAGLSVACQKKPPQGDPSVLDPAPAAPAYQPAPQPVVQETPPPAPAPSTPASPSGTSYTVKPGDTLIKIARAKYHDASAYKRIAAANPGINPDKLKAGQVITLP
jgi:nucleoid-associated protein YgaU